MSNKLLIAQTKLLNINLSDVKDYFEIHKLIGLGVSLVDRTQQIDLPFNFSNYCPLPNFFSDFTKSYEEICIGRAKELLLLRKKLNKPIVILWSGGIDSTVVLISFILAGAGTDDILVSLNNQSMRENYKFYYTYIRNKFNIISSEKICDQFTGNYIVVGGELNDQLFGHEIIHKILNVYGEEFIFQKITESNIKKVFELRNMNPTSMSMWYDLLKNHMDSSNWGISNVFEFFWYFNFVFKWQSVYLRLLVRVSSHNQSNINKNFIDHYYHQFFSTHDFQKWAVLNPDKKIKKNYKDYKLAAKQFIYSFDKDQNYYENKIKYGSLSKVFRHRIVCEGIDDNFKYIKNLDPLTYYNSSNYFNK